MASSLLSLLVLALSAVSITCTVSNFTEVPVNTTCTLGQTFIIQCIPPIYAATASWRLGGEVLLISHPPAGIDPTSRNNVHMLNITCTLNRHYVTVQCIAHIGFDTTEPSPPVWIRVQGLPDKLESINITSNCSSIALVWEAPGGDLTLANDQELAYRVSVYNTTGEEDSPENASRIVQVQDSQFEYTATHPNPAHTFEFVVTGVSPLGDGPPSDRIKAHFTFDDCTVRSTSSVEVHVSSTSPGPEKNIIIAIAVGVPSLVLLFICAILIFTICCFVLAKHMHRNTKVIGIEMTTCDAYETPKTNASSSEQPMPTENSYECIPAVSCQDEHIYEHIIGN